jgi:hypothetical protein
MPVLAEHLWRGIAYAAYVMPGLWGEHVSSGARILLASHVLFPIVLQVIPRVSRAVPRDARWVVLGTALQLVMDAAIWISKHVVIHLQSTE